MASRKNIDGVVAVQFHAGYGSCTVNESVAIDFDESFAILRKKVVPNGGFGWVVTSAMFVITFLMSGCLKSFRVLRPAMMEEWPETNLSEAVWITGLLGTLALMCSPVSGALVKQFGFRVMVVVGGALCSFGLGLSCLATSAGFLVASVGVFMGIGASFVITSSIVCVGQYFTTRKPAALSIGLSGGCVGAMALPPAFGAILAAIGLRYTFLVMAILFLVICACGALAFGPPEDHFVLVDMEVSGYGPVAGEDGSGGVETRTDLQKFLWAVVDLLGLRVLTDPRFVVNLAAIFAMALGSPHFMALIPQQAKAVGIEEGDASNLLVCAAVGELIARLCYGMVAGRSPFPRCAEFALSLVVSAIAVVMVPFCSSYSHFVVVTLLAALGTGMWAIQIPLVLSDNHGSNNLQGTLGLVRLFQGLGALLFPPIGLALRAQHGLSTVLLFVGVMMMVAAVFGIVLFLLSLALRRNRQ